MLKDQTYAASPVLALGPEILYSEGKLNLSAAFFLREQLPEFDLWCVALLNSRFGSTETIRERLDAIAPFKEYVFFSDQPKAKDYREYRLLLGKVVLMHSPEVTTLYRTRASNTLPTDTSPEEVLAKLRDLKQPRFY